jgi:hypothetical protein
MKQIVTMAFLFFTLVASAQNRKCGNETKGHKGKHKMRMGQKLNITDAQKEKMKQYNTQFKTDVKALKSNNKMTLGEFKAKKEALQQQRKENTKSILTPVQLKQAEMFKAERKQKHAAKQEQKITKLTEKLKLTEAQVNLLKTSKGKLEEQKDVIKNDKALTKEQRKEKLKALKESNKMQFQNALTAEQKIQLEELKKNKRGKRAISK